MALTIEISSEALLTALAQKETQFPNRFKELRDEVGFILQGEVMDEAPYITHNLQGATRIDNPDELSVRVFPDEGVAPYALYVILGHRTRAGKSAPSMTYRGVSVGVKRGGGSGFVKGNPYFDRGQANSQAKIDAEVAAFEQWCNE